MWMSLARSRTARAMMRLTRLTTVGSLAISRRWPISPFCSGSAGSLGPANCSIMRSTVKPWKLFIAACRSFSVQTARSTSRPVRMRMWSTVSKSKGFSIASSRWPSCMLTGMTWARWRMSAGTTAVAAGSIFVSARSRKRMRRASASARRPAASSGQPSSTMQWPSPWPLRRWRASRAPICSRESGATDAPDAPGAPIPSVGSVELLIVMSRPWRDVRRLAHRYRTYDA